MAGALRVLLRRGVQALVVVWLVATATFALVHAAPGGPSLLADPKLGATERAALERELGLDRPVAVQYLRWLGALLKGDLGRSFLYQTPTLETVLDRLPNTLLLVGPALLLAIAIAVPLGVMTGRRPGGTLDRLVTTINFASLAVPAFWIGIVLILVVAARWRLLPAGGMVTPGAGGSLVDRLRHLVLPVAVLALPLTAELLRFVRSGVMAGEVAGHLAPARARGVSERSLLRHHVLRNALLPLLTALGLQMPILVGGAAVTESVFSWPGMGRLGIEAALGRDYPLVLAITLVVAATVVIVNLLLDLIYAWADPRVGAGS